jgi:hypothetical protein
MLFIKHLFAGHEVLLVRLPGVLHPGEHGADVAGPRAALPLGPLRPIAASQSVLPTPAKTFRPRRPKDSATGENIPPLYQKVVKQTFCGNKKKFPESL